MIMGDLNAKVGKDKWLVDSVVLNTWPSDTKYIASASSDKSSHMEESRRRYQKPDDYIIINEQFRNFVTHGKIYHRAAAEVTTIQ